MLFLYFLLIQCVLFNVFHVLCFFLPHSCRAFLLGQAGSSLTEAGFASIDAAFPGGVWVSAGNSGICNSQIYRR